MSDGIGGADCESTIEYTRKECHTIGPTSIVDPLRPHEAIGRMLWGHCSHHNNRNQTSHENQEKAQILQVWDDPITENDGKDTKPQDQEVSDVDVPWLNHEIGVVDRVKGYSDVGSDLDDCSKVEDPAEEADPTGKETNNTTPLWTRGEGRPMVNTAG